MTVLVYGFLFHRIIEKNTYDLYPIGLQRILKHVGLRNGYHVHGWQTFTSKHVTTTCDIPSRLLLHREPCSYKIPLCNWLVQAFISDISPTKTTFFHCSNVNAPKIWMAWFWLRAVTYFEPLQYVTTLLQALQPFPWPNLIPSFGPAFFVSHLPRSQYTTAIDPPLLKPSWWSRRHQHWLSCLSRDLLEHFSSAVMLLAMAQTLVRQPWEQRLCGKSLFKKKTCVGTSSWHV